MHYVSQAFTLLPGDVIITGTPSGIGPMQVGDRVEVLIDNIGTLAAPEWLGFNLSRYTHDVVSGLYNPGGDIFDLDGVTRE